MKRTSKINQKFKMLLALAIVVFTSPSLAADFFPLDVWEALTAMGGSHADAYSEPMPMAMNKVEMAHTNFPFDVQKELNDLGRVDWSVYSAYLSKTIASRVDAPNPYWVPDELMSAVYFMDTEN
jgi:hypothetical protein